LLELAQLLVITNRILELKKSINNFMGKQS